MRYKYKNLTQTQLGKLFGVSSHVTGNWLGEVGLRDGKTKKPTQKAHREGYCETAPSGASGYHWVWDAEKTVAALTRAGHRLLEELPGELVYPPALTGPFEAKERSIRNASGQTALRAATKEQAEVVVKLLNAAHRHGTLERLLRTSDLAL
jgi:hypothetical protein